MSSANIRLAARGEQDMWFTGTPKQTYFLAVYKKREPYVLESFEVPFDTQNVPFGTTATCTIPAKGDSIRTLTLKCTLPALFYRKTGWCYPVSSTSFQPYIYLFDSAGNIIELLQVRSSQVYYSAAVRTWVPYSVNLTAVAYDGTRFTYTTAATVARIGFLATDASFFGFDPNLGTKFGLTGIVTYAASSSGLAAPFTLEQSGWVPGFVPPSGLNYVDSVGTYLIKTTELLVGGQTIDVLTGEYIDIRQDLEVQYENQQALLLLNGKGDTSTIQIPRTYYINLPFTPEMDLPIRKLYRQDVKVNVTFEQFSRLTSTDVPLSGYGFSNAASSSIITVQNPTLFSNAAVYDGSNVYIFSYNTFCLMNPRTSFALSSFLTLGDAGVNSVTEAAFVINARVYAVTTDQYIVSFPVINNDTFGSFLTTSYTVFPVGLTRRAACSDGRYIYVYAGNAGQASGTNIVYKFDTQSLTVESYNMGGATISTVTLTNVYLQMTPAFDGRYVYFTDKYQSPYIIRYDTTAAFGTAASWALINYFSLLSVAQQNFLAAIFDGRYMYWITDTQQSTNAVTWLRYDTTLAFTSLPSWSSFVITGVTGVTAGMVFRSPVFDGQYIYVTSGTLVLRYDTTKTFTAAASYDWFNYTNGTTSAGGPATAIQIGGTNTFNVNLFDGRYIFSLPLGTSNVLRQDTSTVVAPTTLQTSIIVEYTSTPENTTTPEEHVVTQTSLVQSQETRFAIDVSVPVKEMFIANQTPASASGPYAYNPLTNVELRFNDEKAFDWTTRTIAPLLFHSTTPRRTVELLSFSQIPESNKKITGSVNFARIRDVQMTVPPQAANTFTRVYTRSYNVFRVENGLGGLKFMSPPFKTMYQPNSRWIYTANAISTISTTLPLSGNVLAGSVFGGIGTGTGPGDGTTTTPTTIPVQKVVTDTNGNIFLTGTYRGGNPNLGGRILPWNYGTPDSFACMYDSTGALVGDPQSISGYKATTIVGSVVGTTLTVSQISGIGTAPTTVSYPTSVSAQLGGYVMAGMSRFAGDTTTYVTGQLTGTPGGVGTYSLNATPPIAGFGSFILGFFGTVTSTTVTGAATQGNNLYICGNYSGGQTAINGYNTYIVLPTASGTSSFVAKYSIVAGSGLYLLWASAGYAAGATTCSALNIAADSEGCYVTGNFTSATGVTFYNADATNTTNVALTATVGTRDGFLVKYSPNGTPLWAARVAVASSTVNSTGIACSTDAGVVVAGSWTGAAGLGAYSQPGTVLTTSITGSTGSTDAFVAKFTTAGVVTWVTRVGAGGQGPVAVAVALDRSVHVTGTILNGTWTVYTQPGTAGTSTGAIVRTCAYVAKWDSAGTVQWVSLQTTTSTNANSGLGITTDAFSNVFVTGLMTNQTTIGTKTFTVQSQDGYLAKYSPSGTYVWAAQIGESAVYTKTFGGSIFYDRRSGTLWSTGSIAGTTYFYNATGSENTGVTAVGNYDTFLVKYSA